MYNYSFMSINHIAIPSFTPTMDPFCDIFSAYVFGVVNSLMQALFMLTN